jgi:hypothetical protein
MDARKTEPVARPTRRAAAPGPSERPRARASKRTLRIATAGAAGLAFVLPWGVLRALPRPASPPAQVIVLSANGQVIKAGGTGHAAVASGSKSLTTTRSSGAPPP